MKSPPIQIHDDIAFNRVEAFIRGEDNETLVGTEESAAASKALAGAAHARAAKSKAAAAPVTAREGRLEAPHRRLEAGSARVREDGRPRLSGGVGRHGTHPGSHQPAGLSVAFQACYLLWPTKRRWSNANFGHVLGLPPDHPRVRALALRAYRTYARYVVELMRLPARAARTPARLEIDGVDELAAAWRGSGKRRSSSPSATSATTRSCAPRSPILAIPSRRRRRHRLSRVVRAAPAQRRSWGVELIPWRNLRELYGVLRRHEMLGLLVDWGYRADGVPVKLFGAWTTLPAGPATLAAKTGALIVPILQARLDDGFRSSPSAHHVTSTEPAELQRARRRSPTRSSARSRPHRSSGTASSRCGRRTPPTRRRSPAAPPRCRPGPVVDADPPRDATDRGAVGSPGAGCLRPPAATAADA